MSAEKAGEQREQEVRRGDVMSNGKEGERVLSRAVIPKLFSKEIPFC